MQHKYAIEAVNRTIRDLLENNSPFGGITVLFGGDFRQTLTVDLEMLEIHTVVPPVYECKFIPNSYHYW